MALTVDDLITSSGKYPERAKSKELTSEVRENLKTLSGKVNALLSDLKQNSKVSSGFRPSAVNTATPGSAKKSLHMIGKAVDLVDADGLLKGLIQNAPGLLSKYGLWMEDEASTPGWCHLDFGTRPDRPVRIFKP